MKQIYRLVVVLLLAFSSPTIEAQINAPLPGRVIVKFTPDYLRPVVYALNAPNSSTPGTLLALNPTNGAVLNEITVGVNPTDMAATPAGDFLYVINAGSRTINKVDLSSFTVQSTEAISTPQTYSTANPLYLAANNAGIVYFTDGAWGPQVYALNYATGSAALIVITGGNQYPGAGGVALSKNTNILYIWQQYGWSAGSENSAIITCQINSNSTTALTVGSNQNRDPLNTPILVDGGDRWIFNKLQKVVSTNAATLLTQFSDYIYAISLDGSIAFGPTEVFNSLNGLVITNFSFAATVEALSGDQKKLFRYNPTTGNAVIYDMSTIASISGLTMVPTPADGTTTPQMPTNLSWSPLPTALSYDVYFGTNQSAVTAATTASPLYLGRIAGTSIAPGQLPSSGTTCYWRVDSIGFNSTNQGATWSFNLSPITFTPVPLLVGGITGYNPASASLSLTAAVPTSWTAAVTGPSWMTLLSSSGTTPAAPSVSFNTASFPAGVYTNNIEFTIGSQKVEVPVTMNIAALNIVKMTADLVRPYIYAIQPPPLSGQAGTLLFINTATGNVDKVLSIGVNPVDLSINYPDAKLYIASWTEANTYVVDLNSKTLLPSLNLGTDIYKVNAGRSGRIITEGEDQWVALSIINTVTGTAINTASITREGDGETDPTGNFYYHCDNDISDAMVHKYNISADTLTETVDSDQHPFGTRNLVLSADGTRLFWNSFAYDTNLNDLGSLGTEIYCCNSNGGVAFGASQAFDTTSRTAIYTLPVASSVSIVDGQNQNFWYFNSSAGTIGTVPMSTIQSPSITQQPAANTGVLTGSSVYLTVIAVGLNPLSYQWTLGGTNISGATNYFLSLPSVQLSQQGAYRVIVSNPVGSVTSTVANVTVLYPPSITTQPSSIHVLAGTPINLSVGASGSAPMTYTWEFQNSPINGATTANLVISNAQQANEGVYQVLVANSLGSATSAVVSVRVDPAAPSIVNNPVSQSVPASSNVTFSVTASGSQPFGYQWFFNNAPLAGAVAAQLTLNAVQSSNTGSYFVVVSNSINSATSSSATLTVTPLAPYFTIQPSDASVSGGTNWTLTGAANGSQPISYQWQHNGSNISGATMASLSLTNLGFADSGPYMLIASNMVGTNVSRAAQLTVFEIPTLVGTISNQVVDAGSNVLLSVNVLGSPTLAYSWRLNGQPIAGANSTLSITNIQLSQSGYYSVIVTNSFGGTSSTARISVLGPVSTVTGWGDNSGGQLNVPGSLADIVAVSGGDYDTLALHHNGTLVAWGYDGNGQTNVPTNALPFVAIASGTDHGLAVTANGAVVAWGRNDSGQCTVPAAATNGVLSIAAGDAHSLSLSGTGIVTAWGNNSYGQVSVPSGLTGVTAIAAGRDHSLALRTDGTVVSWGYNAYGQASPPAGLSNVMAIAGGFLHSVALLSNKTVVIWGDNSFGQTNIPAGLSNVVAIAAGDFDTYALEANGKVVSWGDDSYGQTNVPPILTNVINIAAGNYDGLALMPTAGLLMSALSPSGIVLTWNGSATLQWAPQPGGPYSDIPLSGNAFTNTDMSKPQKYFRLRH